MKKVIYFCIIISIAVGVVSIAHQALAAEEECYLVSGLDDNIELDTGDRQLTWSWTRGENPENVTYKVEVLGSGGQSSGGGDVLKIDYTTNTYYSWADTTCAAEEFALRVTPSYRVVITQDTYYCNPAPSQTSVFSSMGRCYTTAPEIDSCGVTDEQGQIKTEWHETQPDYVPFFQEDLEKFYVRRWQSNGTTLDAEYALSNMGNVPGGLLSSRTVGHFAYTNGGLQSNHGYRYDVSSCYKTLMWCSKFQGPGDTVYSRIEDVTSVTCSNQTASSMTVTVTSPLTNLGVGSSGVKLTDISGSTAQFMPTYQQSTSFNVGGLEPGTPYSFKFQTKNQDGVENSETGLITDASCETLPPPDEPDETDPVVESLSATSPVCAGSNTTLAWSVSDSGGSGLDRVEVWKSTDSGSTWNEVGACRTSVSGTSASGSCSDTVNQTTQYGIHVVDGKRIPVRVLKP